LWNLIVACFGSGRKNSPRRHGGAEKNIYVMSIWIKPFAFSVPPVSPW
jgi:hypothetical protein